MMIVEKRPHFFDFHSQNHLVLYLLIYGEVFARIFIRYEIKQTGSNDD